jgi:hypothetical protein
MTKKSYYHIILDQSGSMQDCIDQTISGFNEQLQVLRSLHERYPDQEILAGLTRFNNEVMHTYSGQNPFSIEKLDDNLYVPDGTTALYDAIGESVLRIRDKIGAELKEGIASVVVIILTDGYENASTVFTAAGISKLIKQLEQTGKWTFSYLGATIDAVEIARGMNIRAENSLSFHKDNISEIYCEISESINRKEELRSKGITSNEFLKRRK